MLLFLHTLTDESHYSKVEYIYNTFHDDMLRLAISMLKKASHPNYEQDAEDVVQNAFVKITKHIEKIDFSVGHKQIKAYIFSIVANEVYNLQADYTYFEDIEPYTNLLSDQEFFDTMKINERYEMVIRAIEQLDDKYRLTLLFRFRDDMSVKEVASMMGLSEKTVYTRLERGKRLLLDHIEREN